MEAVDAQRGTLRARIGGISETKFSDQYAHAREDDVFGDGEWIMMWTLRAREGLS